MRKRSRAKPESIGHRDFVRRVRGGEVASVYIFSGDQHELIGDAIRLLKDCLLGEQADFNFSLFRGEETTPEEILETVETYPMLSPMRLCVVKDAQRIKAADLAPLESYIGSPCPTTCLVLTFDGRPKLDIKPESGAQFVEFTVQGRELSQVVMEEAQKLGIGISRAAADLLVSYLGDNIASCRQELYKLSLYLDSAGEITPELIERLTEKTQFEGVFELVDALSNRDKNKALGLLVGLEAKREEPLSVLNAISWRIRLLWRAKELIEKNTPEAEIARALRVSPRALYYIRKQEKNFTYGDFKRIVKALGEGDRRLKMSYVPREHTLTKLVLDLCG